MFGFTYISKGNNRNSQNVNFHYDEITSSLKNGDYKFEFEIPWNFLNDEIRIYKNVITYHKSDHLAQIKIDWISKKKFNLKHKYVRPDSITGELISKVNTRTFEITDCKKDTIYFTAIFNSEKPVTNISGKFIKLD